jgi:hypothetical protein
MKMENFIFSLITFIVIYLFYVIFVINKKKKLEKFKSSIYVNYLINVAHVNIKQINFKILAHIIALTNSFILSATLFIVSYVSNIILKMLLGFVILIPFQFLMYYIIGKMYQRKKR